MDKDIVIKVDNVSKKFCKKIGGIIKYGLIDIYKSIFGISYNTKLRKNEFWALKNISLKLKKGEAMGVIGVNGSGKSTLLKLLNGIFVPDEGQISVRGKVAALIGVSAGFHPMLTGRENIYINGAILEMSKKQIDKKFASIVNFANIGNFLDTPVKNYSSGMYVRLGFSIAVHCNPDILLVDEVLSICDIDFQKKAIKKMKEMLSKHCSIIFVSHNIQLVLSLTERTAYLKNSYLELVGKTPLVVKKYLADERKMKKNKRQPD